MRLSSLAKLLLITNFLLLTAAVYWSMRNWISVFNLRSAPSWLLRHCLIHTSALTSANNRWRAEFTVSNFTTPTDQTTRAFRYGIPIFNDTRTSALDFIQAHPPNTSHPCWLHPGDRNPPQVSLSAVNAGPTSADTDQAIMSTLLAVLALFIFFGSITTAIQPMRDLEASAAPSTHRISVPTRSYSSALSPDEIDKLCTPDATLEAEVDLPPWTQENVCAICLDDEKDMADAAVLPCGHVFHGGCIRGWLLRGAITCPLCNCRLGEEGKLEPAGETVIGSEESRMQSRNNGGSVLGTAVEVGLD